MSPLGNRTYHDCFDERLIKLMLHVRQWTHWGLAKRGTINHSTDRPVGSLESKMMLKFRCKPSFLSHGPQNIAARLLGHMWDSSSNRKAQESSWASVPILGLPLNGKVSLTQASDSCGQQFLYLKQDSTSLRILLALNIYEPAEITVLWLRWDLELPLMT